MPSTASMISCIVVELRNFANLYCQYPADGIRATSDREHQSACGEDDAQEVHTIQCMDVEAAGSAHGKMFCAEPALHAQSLVNSHFLRSSSASAGDGVGGGGRRWAMSHGCRVRFSRQSLSDFSLDDALTA